jgi:hypothetical protein
MARTSSLASAVIALLFTLACSESSRPTSPGGGGPPAPLKVNAISPNRGSSTTATPVAILGTGFVEASVLTLGGVPTPATFVNSTTLRATAPAHAPGSIDVVVRNPNGDTSELKDGFRYELPLSNLTLSGNLSLQAVGETTQLTAIALYADGSTADVTREARWTVTIPSVATVASDGVVTARALGSTPIQLQFPSSGSSLFRSGDLVVTPAGTRAVWGRVREPGTGDILGATVEHPASGQSLTTNGLFSLGGLSGALRLIATKSGYESAEAEVTAAAFVDIPMQRVVRLEAGAPEYSSRLAPNDVEYVIAGTPCQPCRMVRISSPASGTVTVTLRWPTSAVDLHVWTGGRMIDATGTREIVTAIQVPEGETQIFFGRIPAPGNSNYISFTLKTSGVQ